jgi:hypothetical protein
MLQKSQFASVYAEAKAAAVAAEAEFEKKYGDPWYCGFAWVNIKPGTSPFAKWLKASGFARSSYYKGVDVWNPGGSGSQSMDRKEVGAAAFAAVLQNYGVSAYMMSRAD